MSGSSAARKLPRRVVSPPYTSPSTPPSLQPAGPSPRADALNALRERTHSAREKLAKGMVLTRADLESRLVELSSNFSKLTGYEQIEALKDNVAATERAVLEARGKAKEAKAVLEVATEARKSSQRESNDLLQRKSSWTDADVSRFTELVRRDHLTENDERDARRTLQEREEEVEKGFSDLMRAILARYHEEQVWSDKIRSMSTYGSLAITTANVVVFLLAIILVEPWRRRRLIEGVEARLHEREEVNASRAEEHLTDVVDRLSAAELKLDETLARFAPPAASAVHASDAEASGPDLGALLRDMMGDDEPALETSSSDADRRWRDVVLAGMGGACLGALGVAAALWR